MRDAVFMTGWPSYFLVLIMWPWKLLLIGWLLLRFPRLDTRSHETFHFVDNVLGCLDSDQVPAGWLQGSIHYTCVTQRSLDGHRQDPGCVSSFPFMLFCSNDVFCWSALTILLVQLQRTIGRCLCLGLGDHWTCMIGTLDMVGVTCTIKDMNPGWSRIGMARYRQLPESSCVLWEFGDLSRCLWF